MDDSREEAVLRRWRHRVRAAIPSAEPDVIEEVTQYIAERWLQACDAGADATAADRQAEADLREWQGRTVPRRERPWHGGLTWRGWGADVRFAARTLRVRPIFTVGAILLSGIAVTAIVSGFALVYGILWRPLPYPDADRLAVIWQVRGAEETQISYPDFADVTSADVFDARSAIAGGVGSLRAGDRIERINAISMEAAGLAMLGALPQIGRLLTADDANRQVAMVSHRLWTTHLNSDPGIIGRTIWLSGAELTVVGVLQAGFDFELPVPPSFKRERNDVWRILETDSPFRARRDVSTYEALVRLAPGRTLHEAQAALDTVARRLAATNPSSNTGRTFRVASLKDEVVEPARRPMLFVAMAAVVPLVVALANLVVLGLVRGSERQTELAIREALGAGAFRLRRQLFTEHLLVAIAGTVIGVSAARAVVQQLVLSEAAHLPRADAVRFDAPVWWMAGAVTLLVAVVLTARPLGARLTALRSGARTAGGGVRRSRRLIVALELALALVLSTGGALLALSLSRLLATDPGFTPSGAAAVRVSAYPARYAARDDVVRLFDELLRTLRENPRVSAAGAGSSLPLSGQSSGTSVVAEGEPVLPGVRPTAGWQFITPGYFDATGIPIRAGRDFSPADRERKAHVAIINEDLARALFPGKDPIGRRIGLGGGDSQGDWHEVIGVAADVRHQALDTTPAPRVYDLFGQHWGRTLYVVARTPVADATSLLPLLRQSMRALDAEAPVFEATTLRTLVDRSAATRRLASTVAIGLACAGVLLALIGVYSVAAASVAERTREIGVRAALGAAPRDLFAMIAREGSWIAGCGGVAGLAASLLVVRLMEAQLFGVRPLDALWVLPLVAGAVLMAAVLAAVPPAWRAASVDPLIAIRIE